MWLCRWDVLICNKIIAAYMWLHTTQQKNKVAREGYHSSYSILPFELHERWGQYHIHLKQKQKRCLENNSIQTIIITTSLIKLCYKFHWISEEYERSLDNKLNSCSTTKSLRTASAACTTTNTKFSKTTRWLYSKWIGCKTWFLATKCVLQS